MTSTNSGSAGSYASSFFPQTPIPFREPWVRRHGYTEPYLTLSQYLSCIMTSSLITGVVSRPLSQFFRFHFLTDVPGQNTTIGLTDKRAHFFRVLLSTHWWRNGATSIYIVALTYTFVLSCFTMLHSLLGGSANWPVAGIGGGAATGFILTVVRHPLEVLSATAAAPGPQGMTFAGPRDVFMTSLRQKPSVLLGIYRGFAIAAVASTLQCTALFGLYTLWKYDAVRNGDLYLYTLCHTGAYLGHALQFPFHNMKQSWLTQRSRIKGPMAAHYTLLQHVNELRRRHGITKVYDGFYRFSPFWSAAPAAIALFCFDKLTRVMTERVHPERKKINSYGQSLIVGW